MADMSGDDGTPAHLPCAFVLGGGGALGACEVGMLRALLEAGIKPDLVVGTSVGAINGAVLAAEPTVKAMGGLAELWSSLGRSGVFSGSVFGRIQVAARSRTHLYSSVPLRRLLEDHLPVGADRIEQLPVSFQCVAAGIERAAEHWFTEGPLVDAVLASCAVPGLLAPVEIGGEHFLDGGLTNSIPVGRAVALGARTVYVLQVGRVEEPLRVPRLPWEVASVAFEIARRHRFARLPRLRALRRTHRPRLPGLGRLPRRAGFGPGGGSMSVARTPRAVRTISRRLVTVPLVLVLAVAALVVLLVAVMTAPLTLVIGHRRRLLRFSAFLLLYVLADLAGVAVAGWIWLRCLWPLRGASRNERLQTLSYALLARLLRLLRNAAERIFGLRTQVSPPVPAHPQNPDHDASTPLLVFARHAGPGDSVLLLHALLCDVGLRPQVVLKQFLRLDPCLDVLISRTPHVFVPSGAEGRVTAEAIGALGAAIGPGQAVVIFPEGGNFTEQRRTRAIAWLRRNGHPRRAARAQQQHHVLPPRMPGSLALLGAAAGGAADVVFIAHTGLDRLDSLTRIWRGVPLREPLTARWWRVPGAQVPAGRAAQEEWLTQQWSRIDAWTGVAGERIIAAAAARLNSLPPGP